MTDVTEPRASALQNRDLEATLDSVAVARLIEEVRSTDFEVTRAYNRTYNRHNR